MSDRKEALQIALTLMVKALPNTVVDAFVIRLRDAIKCQQFKVRRQPRFRDTFGKVISLIIVAALFRIAVRTQEFLKGGIEACLLYTSPQ